MSKLDFKKRKFRFIQGKNTFTYEVEQVAFRKPFSHAKWLLTLFNKETNTPYQSWQYADDESMLETFANIAINSDKVEMIENEYTTIKINV